MRRWPAPFVTRALPRFAGMLDPEHAGSPRPGPVQRLADEAAEHAACGDETIAGKRHLAGVAFAVLGVERGSGQALSPFGFMSKNTCSPILAGPFGSLSQVTEPQTASAPQAAKRTFALPSSRVHSPLTSPAVAADADAAAKV
jgi:hypothetical protein